MKSKSLKDWKKPVPAQKVRNVRPGASLRKCRRYLKKDREFRKLRVKLRELYRQRLKGVIIPGLPSIRRADYVRRKR